MSEQTPSRIPPTARPTAGAAFERKVRLSRAALLFERAWPRLWLLLGLGIVFLAVSLAGLWTWLPLVAHKLVLGAFGLAALLALAAVIRTPWPARDEAIHRIERVSGVPHRPASSYEDTLTLGAANPATLSIWQAHRQRLAALIGRLRVGPPHPRTDRRDPIALRALGMLAVLVLGVIVGDSAADRIASAFRFGPSAKELASRLDAWVTPPGYTGRPPIMLTDAAVGAAKPDRSASSSPTVHDIPEKSVLVVRSVGTGPKLSLEFQPAEGGAFDVLPDVADGTTPTAPQAPASPLATPIVGAAQAAPDVAQTRAVLRRSGTVRVKIDTTVVASWAFTVQNDQLPRISLTKPPERTLRGSLRLNYKVEDDYGVVSAEGRIRRLDPKADTSRSAWAREAEKLKGPRRPLERPPVLALQLPKSYPKTAEGLSLHEVGDHRWAGQPVRMTLIAKDLGDQPGRSEPIEFVLPERQFRKPLAKAVIEQRRRLVADSRAARGVARALDALTLQPAGFINDTQVYLGLRSARHRLVRDTTRSGLNITIAQLWAVALRIEDGTLSDAERALKAAQDRLQEALRDGASDEEIQRLMQELRQALNNFLEQMQRNAEGQPQPMPRGMDQNNQTLSSRDLEQMLRNLENMARSGNRDAAQQMLSELRDLLDRLQSGRMAQGDQQRQGQMNQMMNEFSKLLGEQQQLLDDTFREQQGQQGQGQQGQRGQRGQQGQQGQRGQGQQGQQGQRGQGQPGQPGQQGPGGDQQQGQGLGDRQQALRDMLGRLQQGMRGMGVNPPGQLDGAREAMERAERALRRGDLDGAAQEEANALDQLRQGARDMAQQMLQQMPSRFGQQGNPGELDPLDRAPQRTEGPDPGTSVRVPDQIDVQRAREILEELRRRLGEQLRPQIELDYLERLLRRF
jgi:uncharacterized protein (TIGR02302 family)